eukprot:2943462-Amphidinium_carterae.1
MQQLGYKKCPLCISCMSLTGQLDASSPGRGSSAIACSSFCLKTPPLGTDPKCQKSLKMCKNNVKGWSVPDEGFRKFSAMYWPIFDLFY